MGMCCCYHRIVEATYIPQLNAGAIQAERQGRKDETSESRIFGKKYLLTKSRIFSTPRGSHGVYILL